MAEVRLTHGNGITQAVNDALAAFDDARDLVLSTAVREFDARAASLADAAGMYTECDQCFASNFDAS